MKEKVLDILAEVRPDVDFEIETALVDDGVLGSFDVIQIATALMEEYDIEIDADDIEPENLNSLDAICGLVSRKLGEK